MIKENEATRAPKKAYPQLVTARNAWITGGILAGLFVIGLFADLQISEALYNESNPIGIFGAAYGEIPAELAMLLGGLMLIMFSNKEKIWLKVLQIVLGAIPLAFGVFMLLWSPTEYIDGPALLLVVITAVFGGAVVWFVYVNVKDADRAVGVRVASTVLLVTFAEMVLVNVVKFTWLRPRMRMLSEFGDQAHYQAVYVPGAPDYMETLVADGVGLGEFTSFPSGHTANAALAIVFVAFVLLSRKWEGAQNRIYWVGIVWGLYVALSRIIMGAHFLTDTVAGFTITFLLVLAAIRIAFPTAKQLGAPSESVKTSGN